MTTKKLKLISFIIFLMFSLSSCGTVREGFQNPKKNNSDEFLVEKKSPLVLPPEFDELPFPKDKKEETDINKNSLKELFSKNETDDAESSTNKNLEDSLLDKIKTN